MDFQFSTFNFQLNKREREDNPYSRLQQQSLRMLQELSGKRWTDFNEHDPGVTIMDILNYSLLELDYQTGFDFEKYLAQPQQDELEFSQIGLFPGKEIFAPCIVTAQDYENLIESQVKGIKQCEVKLLEGNRYHIFIDADENVPTETLIQGVETIYHRHRNLCENLEKVTLKKLTKKKPGKETRQIDYFQEAEKITVRNTFKGNHTSVQYDFPDAYGINHQGLSSDAPESRQAQALQLRAYLLIFDYLLSATKQQLSHMHQMLALSGEIPPPFSPQIQAENIGQLLNIEKLQKTEIFGKEQLHKQKSAYFDLLDTLYGEDTSFIASNSQLSQEEINVRRAKLIKQFPAFNTNRFRSFDLKDKTLESMAGITNLMQALWNNSEQPQTTLENLLLRYKLRLVNDKMLYNGKFIFSEFSNFINNYEAEESGGKTESVPSIHLLQEQKNYHMLEKRLHFFAHHILLQSLLTHGTSPENYRIKHTGFQNQVILLYKRPSGSHWLNMGFFDNTDTLIETANILWDFLDMLNNQCTAFYPVEQLLLQSTAGASEENCNILYLVFPAWREPFYKKNNYLKNLQERLPIHIESWVVWLPLEEFYRFEQHYFSWRKALAAENSEQVEKYSKEIVRQLKVEN